MTISIGNFFHLAIGVTLLSLACFVRTSNAHPAADSKLQFAAETNKVSILLVIPVDQLYTVAPNIFPQAKLVKTMTEAVAAFSPIDREKAQQYLFDHIKLIALQGEQKSQWQPQLTAVSVTAKGHDLMFAANLSLVPPVEDEATSSQQEFMLFYDGVLHQIKNHKVKVYQLQLQSKNQKLMQKRIKTLRYNDTNVMLND